VLDLESAIRDLEIATAALAALTVEDGERARAILNRRSKALARLANLIHASPPLSREGRQRILESLRTAHGLGEMAGERLARSKRRMMVEWSRWNQIHQALDAGAGPGAQKIDCRG